ncbi:MAG: hypothetical protein K0R38_216 [Polyangiaceae bacterium]|jgi:hypothetical protein|nr:hypothetical protein [Polyangiaceae bacterium]
MKTKLLLLGSALAALGCDGTQYVNADTVALIMTNDTTGVERVNRCHYVPVLLGSQLKARYVVEDELRVTITLTRDDLHLLFEEAGEPVESLTLPSQQFADEAREVAESPPPGFTVELASPCTPKDF